ncbi:hypothetical protein VQ042_19255 [Aurantimonas sp. A2-1-M11]|uniref:hypothetical protein n=1 Tax=Aurantimonas sp. A2-1-M11 TaxID=3113712 RepID=UPI002F935FC6
MAEYRDPKVTTPKQNKSSVGKWVGIILVAILALLLLAWLLGAIGGDDEELATTPTEVQGVVPAEEAPVNPVD